MSELSADNVTIDVSDAESKGQIVIEPGYCEYLRSHGYIIDDVIAAHVVPSDSREMGHVVVHLQTYEYPKGHEKLDYAAHKLTLWVCDCWDWREQSADIAESMVKPSQCGTCKHVRAVSRTERAKADDKQRSLTDE